MNNCRFHLPCNSHLIETSRCVWDCTISLAVLTTHFVFSFCSVLCSLWHISGANGERPFLLLFCLLKLTVVNFACVSWCHIVFCTNWTAVELPYTTAIVTVTADAAKANLCKSYVFKQLLLSQSFVCQSCYTWS